MKNKIIVTILLAVLSAGAVLTYIHYRRKHEDDVAYFALRAIHKQADSVDCKVVAAAAYHEHCMTTVVEMRKWLKDRPYATSNDLAREDMNCILGNADREIAASNACYRNIVSAESEAIRLWEEKYPRQAANMKREALENARKRDAQASKETK